jgi:hypothetical protein
LQKAAQGMLPILDTEEFMDANTKDSNTTGSAHAPLNHQSHITFKYIPTLLLACHASTSREDKYNKKYHNEELRMAACFLVIPTLFFFLSHNYPFGITPVRR